MSQKKAKLTASKAGEVGERSESETQIGVRQRFMQAFAITYDFSYIGPENTRQTPSVQPLTQATVDRLFETFTKEEIKLSGLPRHELVRPSGDFDSAIGGLCLHWPTFKTKSDISDIRGVADPGNACLLRLFRKGLSAVDTVWLDLYSRRADVLPKEKQKQRKTPMDYWVPELRHHHENFTKALLLPHQPRIRVWLVFGMAARTWLERQFQNQPTKLQKITFGSVEIFLELSGKHVERLFIACHHPMYLFFPGHRLKGEQMDASINLFAALTGLEVNENYFAAFYGYAKTNPALGAATRPLQEIPVNVPRLLHQTEKIESHDQASELRERGLVERDPQNAVEKAHLLALLSQSIDSNSDLLFKDLPLRLQKWFDEHDVRDEAQAKPWALKASINPMTYLEVALSVLGEEYDTALVKDAYTSEWALRMGNSKFKDIYIAPDAVTGRPPAVLVYCKACKSARMDYNATYIKTGEYLARKLVCYGCARMTDTKEAGRNQRRILWPVSRELAAMGRNAMKEVYYTEYPDADGAKAFRASQEREKSRVR